MSVGKGSTQRAASAEAKKTTTRKKAVKTTVLTPQNSEELEKACLLYTSPSPRD